MGLDGRGITTFQKGNFMISKISKLSAAALLLSCTPALADWSTSVVTQGQSSVGQTGQVTCPAGGTPGSIWGTGTYTSDSSICGAAQHYGWLPPGSGGVVSYRTVPGQAAYQGSSQNGITTSDYGSWSLSFQITGVSPIPGVGAPVSAQGITWTTTLDQLGYSGNSGSSYRFACPGAGSTSSTIWGTDLYTSDSAICVAATHRGLIQPGVGGVVNVLVLGYQPAYSGTSRNGVTSQAYPEWPTSYTFQ